MHILSHLYARHHQLITYVSISLLLLIGIMRSIGIISQAEAGEEDDCIMYTLVGWQDATQEFHTITIEPGDCENTETVPLFDEFIGGKK